MSKNLPSNTLERLAMLNGQDVKVHDPNERALVAGQLRLTLTHLHVTPFKWRISDVDRVSPLKQEIILTIRTPAQK